MNIKRIALLLLLGVLLTGFVIGLPDSPAETKTDQKLQTLLTKLEQAKEDRQRADLLIKISRLHFAFDLKKARDYARQAAVLSEAAGYLRGHADALNKIAASYYLQADYNRSLEFHFQSLEIRKKIGSKGWQANAYNNIAIVYSKLGDYPMALANLRKSLQLYEETGYKKGIGNYHINVGVIYKNQGNYALALEHYLESLKLYESLGDKESIVKSLNNIGILNKNLGNIEKALETHLRCLRIYKELKDKKGVASAYNNIGSIHKEQGDLLKALEYFSKSLQLAEELGLRSSAALTTGNIGVIHFDRQEYSKALSFYLRAKGIFEEIGDIKGVATANRRIGCLYKATGDTGKAVSFLTQALRVAQKNKMMEIVKDAAKDLAEVYRQTGQFQKAYQYHVLFKETSDSLISEEKVKKITQLEMQYEFDKKLRQQERGEKKKEAARKQHRLHLYVFSSLAILLALVFFALFRSRVKINRRLNKEIKDRIHAEAELMKSMKLETVGILSAGIAHDFNNLLAVIMGSLDMAKLDLDRESKAAALVENAGEATTQAARLIKKFLTISDGHWIERERVTIPEVLTGLTETLTSSGDTRDIPYSVSFANDLKPVLGDQRQLRQVMGNLLLNADEATSQNTNRKRIEISAKNISLPKDNPFSLPGGDYLQASMTDNGKGIAPEILDKIFDPYFSTKERGAQKGMGMGLAFCNAIIDQHGGHIAVTSEVGKGTTFDIYLPVFLG